MSSGQKEAENVGVFIAIEHSEYGNPTSVLRLVERPMSEVEPGPNDALVRVSKRPIHPGDLLIIAGDKRGGNRPHHVLQSWTLRFLPTRLCVLVCGFLPTKKRLEQVPDANRECFGACSQHRRVIKRSRSGPQNRRGFRVVVNLAVTCVHNRSFGKRMLVCNAQGGPPAMSV